jgi:DNA invertase Pin-like site-specific DNA recombinase
MPNANRLTVGIMAMVAEEEGKAISARTKAALAAAKKRDPKLKLGGYRGGKITPPIRKAASAARKARADARSADLAPIMNDLRTAGITGLSGLARVLTERGVPTARGESQWSAVQVARVLDRLEN